MFISTSSSPRGDCVETSAWIVLYSGDGGPSEVSALPGNQWRHALASPLLSGVDGGCLVHYDMSICFPVVFLFVLSS